MHGCCVVKATEGVKLLHALAVAISSNLNDKVESAVTVARLLGRLSKKAGSR